jgi:hypothetical protein
MVQSMQITLTKTSKKTSETTDHHLIFKEQVVVGLLAIIAVLLHISKRMVLRFRLHINTKAITNKMK